MSKRTDGKKLQKVKDNSWVNEVSENYRDDVRKVRSLLVMIGDYWVLYPLWVFAGMVSLFLVLLIRLDLRVVVFGLNQVISALIVALVLCFVGLPSAKLLFLKRCKRFLSELEKELSNEKGSAAYEIVAKKEGALVFIFQSAKRRRLRDWFFVHYHCTTLDKETKEKGI